MKKSDNYMDRVPVRNDKFRWERDEDGNVTIFVENKGVFNRIAQKFFGKPEVTKVHLEGLGNYIWTNIDGKKSVYDIGQAVKEKYGDEAEPLYPRLVKYMSMLENYDFIKS